MRARSTRLVMLALMGIVAHGCSIQMRDTVRYSQIPKQSPGAPSSYAAAVLPPPAAPPASGADAPTTPRSTRLDRRTLGQSYALLIGNQRYEKVTPLETPESDVAALGRVLETRYGFRVTAMLNASRKEIRAGLRSLRNSLGEDDNLLIFYAGHGAIDQDTKRGYWIPVDAGFDEPSEWVAVDDVTNELKAMRARHVLVVSDSCYSASLTRDVGIERRPNASLEKLAQRKMRRALTAGGMHPVLDAGSGSHSVFAGALIRALEDGPGLTLGWDLYEAVAPQVRRNTAGEQRPEYNVIPGIGDEDGEFIFSSAQ